MDELFDDALAVARRHAGQLSCAGEPEVLQGLLARGGPRGPQRVIYEIAAIDGLLGETTEMTDASFGG